MIVYWDANELFPDVDLLDKPRHEWMKPITIPDDVVLRYRKAQEAFAAARDELMEWEP